jgi:hypothetical protein
VSAFARETEEAYALIDLSGALRFIRFWGVPRLVYRTTDLSADTSRRAMTTHSRRIPHSGYCHNVLTLRLCSQSSCKLARELHRYNVTSNLINHEWLDVTQILRNPNSMTLARKVVSDLLPKV